jgi:hypothetical protein
MKQIVKREYLIRTEQTSTRLLARLLMLTKGDLVRLQAQEKFNEIFDEELEALQNLGNNKED